MFTGVMQICGVSLSLIVTDAFRTCTATWHTAQSMRIPLSSIRIRSRANVCLCSRKLTGFEEMDVCMSKTLAKHYLRDKRVSGFYTKFS